MLQLPQNKYALLLYSFAISACAVVFMVVVLRISPFGISMYKEQELFSAESPFIVSGTSILQEAASPGESKNIYWWLDSGGVLFLKDGYGKTNVGFLPADAYWRRIYASTNPADTDGGYRPQNIFRLVSRTAWNNVRAIGYFKILATNTSESQNRNESNGILLMSRYQDHDNLYYAGIRVDGNAVIKKKTAGRYYTMALRKVFVSSVSYDRDKNPNVLPEGVWIGLAVSVVTNQDDSVDIKLFIDKARTGTWVLALEARDDGKKFSGPALVTAGLVGIRTDFMDVQFDRYAVKNL